MRIAMLNAKTAPAIFTPPGYFGGNQLELIAEAAAHKPDILLAPEYFLYDIRKAPFTIDEKDRMMERIAEIAGEGDRLTIPGTMVWEEGGSLYHAAPVFISRNKVKEYHKATDGGASGIGEDYRLFLRTGNEAGAIINWRNMRIGLEICMDHKLGMLKKSKRKTDLHIVLGCNGELIGENNTARRRLFRKGYMLLCDGFRECRANPGSGKFIDDIQPEKQGNVLLYEIEI